MSAESEMVTLPCDYCGAEAGKWCHTSTGRRCPHPHAARYYLWKERQYAATVTRAEWPPIAPASP